MQLRSQGWCWEDHEKMSKSRGNVVAPDDLAAYGADTVRLSDVLCPLGTGRT